MPRKFSDPELSLLAAGGEVPDVSKVVAISAETKSSLGGGVFTLLGFKMQGSLYGQFHRGWYPKKKNIRTGVQALAKLHLILFSEP